MYRDFDTLWRYELADEVEEDPIEEADEEEAEEEPGTYLTRFDQSLEEEAE